MKEITIICDLCGNKKKMDIIPSYSNRWISLWITSSDDNILHEIASQDGHYSFDLCPKCSDWHAKMFDDKKKGKK